MVSQYHFHAAMGFFITFINKKMRYYDVDVELRKGLLLVELCKGLLLVEQNSHEEIMQVTYWQVFMFVEGIKGEPSSRTHCIPGSSQASSQASSQRVDK
jgi:hypothetical protein